MKIKKAFSLIELSIVILVIGILIAGVIQGSKLYYKFKLISARTMSQSSDVNTIKDLVLWIDATQEGAILNSNNSSQLEDGDNVIQWTDRNPQSTNRLVFTRLDDTSNVYPLYRSNAINGLPAIEFQGPQSTTSPVVGGWLSAPTNSAIENPLTVTFFLVLTFYDFNYTNGVVGIVCKDVTFTGHGFQNGIGNPPYCLYTTGAAFGFRTVDSNNSTSAIVDYYLYRPNYASKTPIFYTVINNGTNMYIYTRGNDRVYTTGTSGTDIGSSGGYLNLGAQKIGYPDRQFSGNIGEVIMYNRALTTEERKSVEKYLSKKWGIPLL